MAINHVGTQGIKDSRSATTTAGRSAEDGRFVGTRAFKEAVAGFGERTPVYQPSSGFASRVASNDMAVTASSSVTS